MKLQSNSVTRQVTFNRTKISGKCQNSKIQMRHFEGFSNNVQEAKNIVLNDVTQLSQSNVRKRPI